jgi:hypothetical protein
MVDFQNGKAIKLSVVDNSAFAPKVTPTLIPGEEIVQTFKAIRDGVVFTTKRIFVINVQGVTGKKVDYTSLPYSKIQAFSVESAGTFDIDCELELWFSGLGRVKLEFVTKADVAQICRWISQQVL